MTIKKHLLNWYAKHQRVLPFRGSNNPYHIWISEIMAQQTQIDTMIPYYERWMSVFPTIESVANASEVEILKMWEGLGYYRRARFIHQAAKKIVNDYQGVFPHEYEEVRSLPGIGDYTAGAIMSIAFNSAVVAIDGNVVRVISRLYGIHENPSKRTTLDIIKNHMAPFLDNENNHLLTQAWMELGALVCTPKNPKCNDCPLQLFCYANQHNKQSELPMVVKKSLIKKEFYDVILNFSDETIFMSLDDSDGLMQGMYRLPQVSETIREERPVFVSKHIYSHKTWTMNVFVNQLDNTENVIPIKIKELKNVPIITAHKKIIDKIIKR
jgi:A/G-specific adenine glycosylase